MTNQEIIYHVVTNKNAVISEDMNRFVINNYKEGSKSSSNDWHMVVKQGNDPKYGRLYIDPVKMLWRGLTISEFYGNGTVD